MKKVKFILFAVIFLFLGIILEKINNREVNILDNDNITIKKDKNMLSMMLETEANSGNYELTTRESWPTDGYVFNSELSKCENGSELSWDDENKTALMSGNVSDKCYVYFDVYVPPRFDEICDSTTLACHVAKLYMGIQGDNGIYYHNGTIKSTSSFDIYDEDYDVTTTYPAGTILDANDNSYRYAGANPNNYVCFGSTASPCPTDNLYRIIGVFGDQVKLIKYDYATSALLGTDGDYYGQYTYGSSYYKGSNYANVAGYYWNKATSTNTWSNSNLNKTNLNTNFINNIGSTWSNKIATTTWKVGGNTWINIGLTTPSVAYQNEVANPLTTASTGETDYSAKIGLMYVSDYGFAADPSAWTLTMLDYNDTTATSTNWMYMGLYEWTISRDAYDSNYAFYVHGSGSLKDLVVVYADGVRPSFNLLSSVTYVSGSGTSSDPIIIGD